MKRHKKSRRMYLSMLILSYKYYKLARDYPISVLAKSLNFPLTESMYDVSPLKLVFGSDKAKAKFREGQDRINQERKVRREKIQSELDAAPDKARTLAIKANKYKKRSKQWITM